MTGAGIAACAGRVVAVAADFTGGGKARIIWAVSAASDAGATGAGLPTRSATANTMPIAKVVAPNRSQLVRTIMASA
jgi:hypothetical protein